MKIRGGAKGAGAVPDSVPIEPDVLDEAVDVDVLDLQNAGKRRRANEGDARPAPLPAALKKAAALEKAGKIDLALAAYATVARNEALADGYRVAAAIAASKLADTHDRGAVAEHYCLAAERIAPDDDSVLRRRLMLFKAQRATTEVLALTERLLLAHPNELSLLRIRVDALIEDARPEDAVLVGERAYALAEKHGSVAELSRTAALFAFALTKSNKSARAVEVLEACLAKDPENDQLHLRISEYVQPDFDDEQQRAAARYLFGKANESWRAGDFPRVRELALEILELDARDGLAHRMYATAGTRMANAKLPLLPQVDTEKEHKALIGKIEEVAGRARIDGREGRVTDLFPDWPTLDPLQRATLAYSVLGYAKVIPAIMENGGCIRFAAPGTSLCEIDPQANIRKKKAFGRMSYVGRGWAYHEKGKVYCGLERIDEAARGAHNTVTHEFGHLVHFYFCDLVKREKDGARLSAEEQRFAACVGRIEDHYAEAKKKENGQRLLDAYSGTTVWEYFAQGIMSYLAMDPRGKESAPRLYTRNPKLWHVVADIVNATNEYPPEAPGPNPPPVGLEEVGSPRQLTTLADKARSKHIRTLSAGLVERLRVLIEDDNRPWKARAPQLDAILSRALELQLIESGRSAKDSFARAAELLPSMSAAELEAQVLLHIEARALAREPVGELQALLERLKGGDLQAVRGGLA